jgi:hypothetical protein
MIRQLLNLPNKAQKLILEQETNLILDRCDVIAKSEYNEQLEAKQFHDARCPKCREKEKIVDRICHVQGNGSIKGNFILGFGSIHGSTTIDTIAANHCNNCGHEWIKFKTKYVSNTKILRVVLNYLAEILIDATEKNRSWKMEAIQVFDGCSAETIYKLRCLHENYLHDETTEKLSLSCLRRYYKSIYFPDGNFQQKLEKI